MDELSTNNIPKDSVAKKATENNEWSELNVRSAEVQQIIGRPPHWLIRWGITAFFGILGLVLLTSWFISYPETIHAPLRLTAINAPTSVESRQNGKLVRLFFENNTLVEEGQILAWVESTADHQEVIWLDSLIEDMRVWLGEDELSQFSSIELAGYSNLGELQGAFQAFEQSWRQFKAYLPGGIHQHRRQILEQEMQYNRRLLEILQEQRQTRQREYELIQQEYRTQQELVEMGAIAASTSEQSERALLSGRLPLQQMESSIINARISLAAKQQELITLDREIQQQSSVFRQALNTLHSSIEEWKSTYLMRAPLSGKLVYTGFLQENQTLQSGQHIFYIQPENTRFFGEMPIAQSSYGKIREGQQVLVRFSSYPAQEFGSIAGRIEYLSDFPLRDSVFLASVGFPDGFVTNYGHELTPRNGMTGQAEIITQDMRLVERFYNNIAQQLQ